MCSRDLYNFTFPYIPSHMLFLNMALCNAATKNSTPKASLFLACFTAGHMVTSCSYTSLRPTSWHVWSLHRHKGPTFRMSFSFIRIWNKHIWNLSSLQLHLSTAWSVNGWATFEVYADCWCMTSVCDHWWWYGPPGSYSAGHKSRPPNYWGGGGGGLANSQWPDAIARLVIPFSYITSWHYY